MRAHPILHSTAKAEGNLSGTSDIDLDGYVVVF